MFRHSLHWYLNKYTSDISYCGDKLNYIPYTSCKLYINVSSCVFIFSMRGKIHLQFIIPFRTNKCADTQKIFLQFYIPILQHISHVLPHLLNQNSSILTNMYAFNTHSLTNAMQYAQLYTQSKNF